VTKNLFLSLILGGGFAACATQPPRRDSGQSQLTTTRSTPTPAIERLPETLPELLKLIEVAYRRGHYAQGLALVKKALELEKNNVSAMDRIGSIYYVLGRYGEALTIWKKALPLEQDLRKRRALENSISVARRSLGLIDDAPIVERAVEPARLSIDKNEIQELQRKGVRHYASGEYLQATTVFLRILELDPENADAAKALKRLQLGP
jgi:tetratricopeptide (TPR) repeat protein